MLLGGGASITGRKAALAQSRPGSTGRNWVARAIGTGPGMSGTDTLTAYVICSGA
jgi:hypothetical protein